MGNGLVTDLNAEVERTYNGFITNPPLRKLVYLLPLEGVRGEEPSIGEGLGGLSFRLQSYNILIAVHECSRKIFCFFSGRA